MKSTIQAIYAACGKQYPTDADTLKTIDFLSELIDENHSLDEPDEFDYDGEPDINDYDSDNCAKNTMEYQSAMESWRENRDEALQEYQEENEANYSELFEAIEFLECRICDIGADSDFYFEYDGNEYRIIAESAVWDIYVDEIKNIVNDCYDLKLDNIPSFVAWEIDWEQTAKNAYVDGYGHTFSGYDGSELEIGNYFVFRTN